MKQFLQIHCIKKFSKSILLLKNTSGTLFILLLLLSFNIFTANAQTISLYCQTSTSEFDFTYVGFTYNSNNTVTLTFSIQTHGKQALSHASFGLPAGAKASKPTSSKFSYTTENGTNNPFYSIKFEATNAEGFKNGASDSFSYTLTSAQFASLSTIQVEAKAAKNTEIVSFNATACASAPFKIAGPEMVETSSLATYTVQGGDTKGRYFWTVPTGWEIISGQGTNTIQVKASEQPGELMVKNEENTYSTMAVSSYSLPPSTLPVSLTSFTAAIVHGKVVLNWATASEKDNKAFVLERSIDAVHFKAVQNVAGQGTTTVTQTYSTTDTAPLAGTIYYRLKQIDFDGAFEYSKIISVEKKAVAKAELTIEAAYPNPFQDQISVKVDGSSNETVYLQLVDLNGKVVASEQAQVLSGTNQLQLQGLAKMQNGIYILKINQGSQTSTQRLVKAN